MKARHVIAGVYFTALVFVGAWFWGTMFRGEMSPWVWEDYASHVRKHGQGDAIFAVSLYLLFYSGAFSVPFVFVRGIALSLLKPDAARNQREIEHGVDAASALIAGGSGLMSLVALRAIVAFFASLPNGLLVAASMAIGGFLVWAGISALRDVKRRIILSDDNSSSIPAESRGR